MSDLMAGAADRARAPWHVWAVGILSLLWNASGAYTIMSAQAGALPGLRPDEAAYYAAQPLWFAALTDIGLVSAMVAAIALLLRRRWAMMLYAVSLALILVTASYDLAAGTSRVYANQGAMIVTILIDVLAVLQLAYASAMRRRGVLR